MEKKLYKSNKDKKISGVCAGLAEYLNIDPTLVRLLWVLFCFVGAGILAYIIAAIIIPEQPTDDIKVEASESDAKEENNEGSSENPYKKTSENSDDKTEFI